MANPIGATHLRRKIRVAWVRLHQLNLLGSGVSFEGLEGVFVFLDEWKGMALSRNG
jgi:hypothetical protein